MSNEGKMMTKGLSLCRELNSFRRLNSLKRYGPSKANLFKVLFSVASFYLICTVITTYTYLGECGSDSLQGVRYALFLKTSSSKTASFKTLPLKRGDIVLIQSYPLRYGTQNNKIIKDKKELGFAKRLLGMPGDLLSHTTEGLYVVSSLDTPIELAPLSWSRRDTGKVLSEPHEAPSREIQSPKAEGKSKTRKSKTLPLLKRTKYGDPLTPLRAERIPAGYVFVAGDHPRSFDSRYEEFGLVPLDKIWGRALFAW